MSEVPDNETRRIIADAVATGQRDVRLTCNPAFDTLDTILVEGVPGQVRLSFAAGEGATQGNGVVSGGTFAAMLDGAMAVAVLSALKPGQTCSTISLSVNMLRPGLIGRLFVDAGIEKLGARVAFAHARLMDGEGQVLATGTSSLAVIGIR